MKKQNNVKKGVGALFSIKGWYNIAMHIILYLIWYMIAILPTFIFLEMTKIIANFLKRKNIYLHWDFWHSFVLILVILAIIIYSSG